MLGEWSSVLCYSSDELQTLKIDVKAKPSISRNKRNDEKKARDINLIYLIRFIRHEAFTDMIWAYPPLGNCCRARLDDLPDTIYTPNHDIRRVFRYHLIHARIYMLLN